MSDFYELRSIESHCPLMRDLARSDSYCQDDKIPTRYGTLNVAVQGEKNKPTLLTYHDIGLNHVSNFQSFFNYSDTRNLIDNFCLYHINAPGQEEDAPTLPDGYVYPTMDQLADAIEEVLNFYGIKSFIGIGVGAGANILARFALNHPNQVEGLFLINCSSSTASWTEWGYQKLNCRYLRNSGMNASTLQYLMWHHFGKFDDDRNHDLEQVYRSFFNTMINPTNLALFIESFIKRNSLDIKREYNKLKKNKNFTCYVMLVSGAFSPQLDEVVDMNGKLDPSNSTWMKLSDCGMVLEEEPGKVCEALRLFLQGLGYVLTNYRRKLSSKSSYTSDMSSIASQSSIEEITKSFKREVHIVENPINQHAVSC